MKHLLEENKLLMKEKKLFLVKKLLLVRKLLVEVGKIRGEQMLHLKTSLLKSWCALAM